MYFVFGMPIAKLPFVVKFVNVFERPFKVGSGRTTPNRNRMIFVGDFIEIVEDAGVFVGVDNAFS